VYGISNRTLANDQLDAQIFLNTFITILHVYMFRAISCSSLGSQIVLIQHLVSSMSVSDSPVHRLRKKFVMQNKQNRCINTRTSKQNCVPRKNNAAIWYNKTCRIKQLSSFSTCAPDGHLLRVTISDAILIQFDILRMSKILLETCRGL
jgi:hypothetical protein